MMKIEEAVRKKVKKISYKIVHEVISASSFKPIRKSEEAKVHLQKYLDCLKFCRAE
jgi:hypothetical protein